ncbi:hypothetical protein GGI06_000609 [Coemansia sp. S85]|nr:hypothetical protein GGI06_000609 [Coemansia sp. S85]
MDDDDKQPTVTKPSVRGIPLLRSCERCRRRKQRCDGDQPSCGRCAGQRAECKYRQSGRFRKRNPPTAKRASALEAATALSCLSTPAIMFQVPELSPASLFTGDVSVSPESRCTGPLVNGVSTPMLGLIDPVEILKTRDLPDLSQGLPDGILQRMWALVGGQTPAAGDAGPLELAPNLGLLDPHNAQAGAVYKVPAALASAAQRHGLPDAGRLLSMLRASFVDSGMKIRTRQFWVTLEAGRIGDFALLAHLAIAVREASLTQAAAGLPDVEAACFAAARREWDGGRVAPTTGAVFALLLLSEYGYQTGRPAVMREFADHAIAAAQRIVFRGAAYPWQAAGERACDVEREHLLACFWSAWIRLFTAAQVLGRPVPVPSAGRRFPAFPTHDMCHYTAQPVAGAAVGAVAFPAHTACRHSASGAYSAATWQCALLGAEMHNRWVQVAAGAQPRVAYFSALRAWDRRLRLWRAEWPAEWLAQMSRLARLAQRVPAADEPLRLDAEWLADLGAESPAPTPQLPPTPDTRPVGAHLFHESRMTAADSWLAVVFVMYDMTRLRAHRVALDLGGALADDPLAMAIAQHASRAETLDAARDLQNVLACVQTLGFPPARMGMWIVFVLEQTIDVHCAAIFRDGADPAAQADALERLACAVRHLLALKHWTAALYVFAALVKRHVEPTWVLSLQAASRVAAGNTSASPWPPTHVLTLLMRALRMDPRQFCAFTMPVVYASVMSTPVMPQSMRMRIASLLS